MERIKELEAEKSKLLDEAKTTALEIANNAIAELNELGFTYQLIEGGKRNSTAPSRIGTRAISADKICPICKIVTDPPHDARHKLHRAQGQNKKPLTDAELSSAGLTKV